MFVLLLAAGSLILGTDRPLELVGRAAEWLLNRTRDRADQSRTLPRRLLDARDFVRTTLGREWWKALLAAAGNTGFDYLALLAALRAVGAEPRPSLVLLAYTAAEVLALVPVTPGGLDLVEAGLVGTLGLAGVAAADALAATSSTGSSLSGSRCRRAASRTSSSGDDTLRDNDARRRDETR